MGVLGAIGAAGKGVGKAASRLMVGAADSVGLSKIKKLDNTLKSARRGASYYIGRGLTDVATKGAPRTAFATAQAAIAGTRGFNALATRPARAGQGNLFGRELRPWAVGSLALATLVGGSAMYNQTSAMSAVEFSPRTDPTMLNNYEMEYYKMRTKDGEAPFLMQDASHNYSNMGATGDLAIALHKNRHG